MTARATGEATGRGVWTRYLGVTLVACDRERIASHAGLVRALTDGHDRGAAAAMPPETTGEWYEARSGGDIVGEALVRRDYPLTGQASLLAVATAPEARGRAVSTKVALGAERKLSAEGYAPMLVRVPRTNGRGLYFMLRCGFTPVPAACRPDDPCDATWFARHRDRTRLG